MTAETELGEVKTILKNGLKRGAFKEGNFGYSYCAACGKSHAKKWFTAAETQSPFYVCLAKRPTFVMKQEGKYVEFTIMDFARLFSNNSSKEIAVRQNWGWFRRHHLRPDETEVQVSLMPPFVSVSLHYKSDPPCIISTSVK